VSLYHKLVVLARFSSGRFFIYITALFWLVFSLAYTAIAAALPKAARRAVGGAAEEGKDALGRITDLR
jgi:hypothetical protein